MATVGIHLVWTAYGTWLPGDDRGHWSPLYHFYGDVIERGGQLNRSDLTTREFARERLTEPVKILTQEVRTVIVAKLGTLLGGRDQSKAYAAAIEDNHVHLLLGPFDEKIHVTAGRLKGCTSSAVLELPANKGRARTWTAKYWKVFLFDDTAFWAVKQYIEEHNLRRGLPASPYDWLTRMKSGACPGLACRDGESCRAINRDCVTTRATTRWTRASPGLYERR